MDSANETPWQRYSRRMAVIKAAEAHLEQEKRQIEEELTIADLQAAKRRVL